MSGNSRALSAFEDVVAVEHDTDSGVMRIVTWSDAYVAIPSEGQHLCPDREYNDPPRCKHEWAADVTRDQLALDVPTGWLVTESLDERPPQADCEDCADDLACFEHFGTTSGTPGATGTGSDYSATIDGAHPTEYDGRAVQRGEQ